VLLAQPALVLRLHVHPPLHRELEGRAAALERGDRIGVGQALERRVDEGLDAADAVLVDAIGEERHVVAALVQQRGEDVLEERLRQVGVGRQVGEGDLGLHHPELGEMTAGVAVLGAERRAEGVDLGEGEAIALDVQLAADGEEGLLAEEILAEVSTAVGRPRQRRGVGDVERADAEHLAGALGVAGRDDRRVHPEKAVLVKVAVHGHAQAMTHAGHRAERVRARPKVRDVPQILERRPLLLDWVGLRVVNPADDLDRLGLQFDRLSLALALCQHAVRDHRASRGQPPDLTVVVGQVFRGHHLDRGEARTVVHVHEGEAGL
jgi:hypothetical protein